MVERFQSLSWRVAARGARQARSAVDPGRRRALGARARPVRHHTQRSAADPSIWNMGFDAIRWLWRYFLLGAVIVIPIWLILRFVTAPKGRKSSPASFRP